MLRLIPVGDLVALYILFVVLTSDGYYGFLMNQERSLSFESTLSARGRLFSANEEHHHHASTTVKTDFASITRRSLFITTTLTTFGATTMTSNIANARLEPVNNAKLLPKEPGLNVIQIEKFLTSGQAKRLDALLFNLERDSGYRVRVLCQAYPNTPGLAIRDYWDVGYEGQKDDKYVVMVVDQFGGKGNALNFNVGEGVKLALPNVFWNRLQAKYGTTFYVRDYGIDVAIINAIEAIATCLRSEDQYCIDVPDAAPSLRSLGFS